MLRSHKLSENDGFVMFRAKVEPCVPNSKVFTACSPYYDSTIVVCVLVLQLYNNEFTTDAFQNGFMK